MSVLKKMAVKMVLGQKDKIIEGLNSGYFQVEQSEILNRTKD